MADSPLIDRLRRRAQKLGSRALEELMSSEGRADAVGVAVKGMQHGRRLMDEQGAKVLAALGLATKPDLERVSRKVGRLRKRLDAILDTLEDDAAER